MTNITLPSEVVEQAILGIEFIDSLGMSAMPSMSLNEVGIRLRAALANAEQSKIWVLTEEYNDYDQHGGYFVQAWVGKPTAEQLKTFAATVKENWSDEYVTHLLAGGGRKKVEYHWYLLEEQP